MLRVAGARFVTLFLADAPEPAPAGGYDDDVPF